MVILAPLFEVSNCWSCSLATVGRFGRLLWLSVAFFVNGSISAKPRLELWPSILTEANEGLDSDWMVTRGLRAINRGVCKPKGSD